MASDSRGPHSCQETGLSLHSRSHSAIPKTVSQGPGIQQWWLLSVSPHCLLLLKPSGQTQTPGNVGWAFTGKSRDALGEKSLGSYPDKDREEEVSAELLHPLGSHLPVIAVIGLFLDGLFLHCDGGSGTCKGDK